MIKTRKDIGTAFAPQICVRGIDNAVKGGTLLRLKTVLDIAYMRIYLNGEVCVVGVKRRMISLTMNLY